MTGNLSTGPRIEMTAHPPAGWRKRRHLSRAHPSAYVLLVCVVACGKVVGPSDVIDPEDLHFISVDAEGESTCAVDERGVAYCWGWGSYGQLGNGTVTSRRVPARVSGDVAFTSVTLGTNFACGVATDGAAWCWGGNEIGQLGDGTTERRLVPTAVAGNLRFRMLSAGFMHVCGVATDGAAYCWGGEMDGRPPLALLGQSRDTTSAVPVRVAGGHDFTEISANLFHTCAVDVNQDMYCWGANFGRLGVNSPQHVPEPNLVPDGFKYANLGALSGGSCGITASGEGICWGSDDWTPHRVLDSLQLRSVGGGAETSGACVTTVDDVAYCWGGMDWVAGTPRSGRNPLAMVPDVRFRSVSGGSRHVCGLSVDGLPYCWGQNGYGQLGDRNVDEVRAPHLVPFREVVVNPPGL